MRAAVMALAIVLLAAGAVLFLGVSASTPPLRDASGTEAVEAPHVELVVFEHAAHLPFLAEPERFVDEVTRVAGR